MGVCGEWEGCVVWLFPTVTQYVSFCMYSRPSPAHNYYQLILSQQNSITFIKVISYTTDVAGVDLIPEREKAAIVCLGSVFVQIIEPCFFLENGPSWEATMLHVTVLWETNNGDITTVHHEPSTCYCTSILSLRWHLKCSFSTLITGYQPGCKPGVWWRLFKCLQSGEIKIE